MKRWLFAFLLVFLCHEAGANDQLAYLSKANAEKAAALIRKQRKLFIYCGCCTDSDRRKLRPQKVIVRSVGDDLYQVIVTYTPARAGIPVTVAVDLAYTWMISRFKYQTIGTALGLPHGPCKPFKKPATF
jgi:hypothetical protein